MNNFIGDLLKKKNEKSSDKKGNNLNKVISVIMAVILWTYVIGEVNPETTAKIQNINVQLMNISSVNQSGLVMLGSGDFKVNVVIKGKRGDVLKITPDDIVAKVDLKGYGKGLNEIPVEVTAPASVSVIEVNPARVSVRLDQIVTRAKPVKAVVSNSLPEGYEPGTPVVNMPEIFVDGPESLVDSVVSLNADIELKSAADEFEAMVPVAAVDGSGNKIEQVTPQNGFVKVTVPILRVKDVPLSIDVRGKPGDGYAVSDVQIPKTVKIKGPDNVVGNMEEVTAKPIDLSDVTANAKIPVKLNLPPGVMLADKIGNVYVNVIIEKLSSKIFTFKKSEINIVGLKDSLSADMSRVPDIVATITAGESDIKDIDKEDVVLSINLADSDPGDKKVKIEWSSDKKISKVVLEPDEIDVKIQK